MNPLQVFVVAALGGLAGVVGLALFIGLCLIVFAAIGNVVEAHETRRDRRRALKAGRQRLHRFTTIDDLKD